MEQKNLNQIVNMDAKVSFDDLVNIFVSRHEEELHTKRGRIQTQIKELNASKVALIKAIREVAHDSISERFEPIENMGVKAKFTVVVAEQGDLSKTEFWDVDVKQRLDIVAEQAIQWRPKNSVYSDEVSQSVVLQLKVRICDEQVQQWAKIDKELAVLKEQLLLVNGDIQAIDRKTRQIKGLLATKKLEDMGAEQLLELPEVQNILKLTQG